MLKSLFNKVADLKVWNFIKKKFQHRCFPVNIAKFLKSLILKNICEQLHLSMVNGHNYTKSRLHYGWLLGMEVKHMCLTLPVPIPDVERKTNLNFLYKLLCRASGGFTKTLKAFIKPFEEPQRSVKITI